MTFGQNGQKLNSRPVYWSRLYGTEIQNLDKDQTLPALPPVGALNIWTYATPNWLYVSWLEYYYIDAIRIDP